MLGSCYNMNLNILDKNKELLIADPIMGSRYDLNLIILHVIDLLVIADPIMESCYNMNLIIITFYWWPDAWVLAFAGWPHVGVLAFVGPMSGSYCSCPSGYLWETKLSCNVKMIDPRQSWQNQILFWILTNFILILILIHILIVFLISLQFINYPTSTVKDIGVDNVHYSECLGPVPVFMSLSH